MRLSTRACGILGAMLMKSSNYSLVKCDIREWLVYWPKMIWWGSSILYCCFFSIMVYLSGLGEGVIPLVLSMVTHEGIMAPSLK